MSKSASFTVAYDGDSVKNHLMDVRDLAPALLSIGQLFDEANRVLNGDHASIKLQVKALQEGSFEISFEMLQTITRSIAFFYAFNVFRPPHHASNDNSKAFSYCGHAEVFFLSYFEYFFTHV